MSVSRITSRDLQSWCWATGTALALWERRAIRAIDIVWTEVSRER